MSAEQNTTPEYKEPKRLTYTQPPKSGLVGGSLSSTLLPVIVAVIISLLIAVYIFPTKSSISGLGSTLATNFNNLQTQLTNTINTQMGAVSSIPSTVSTLSGKVEDLATQVGTLATKADLDALKARVNTLENPSSTDGSTITEKTSRWDFRADFYEYSPPTLEVCFDWDIDPRRIEEEDLYEVTLYLLNNSASTVSIGTRKIEVVLEPKENVVVDEDETYLDSDETPYLDWDPDFTIRTREGVEVCRRISFVSDSYNFGDLAAGSSKEFKLVLELHYA